MSKADEIVSFYLSEMNSLSKSFPIEEKDIIASHKKTMIAIKSKYSLSEIPSDIKSSIEAELSKLSLKNSELYKDELLEQGMETENA